IVLSLDCESPTVGKPEFTGVGTLIVREAGCAPSRKMSANRSHKDEPGRYTHRVAISNHRLVSLADGQVTFRWRDSAHNNERKLMTLSIDEFLRAASCCICSLSASSAFATWASSSTDGARFCCHFSSQHSFRYRLRLNQHNS